VSQAERLRSLKRLGRRRHRDQERRFLVEGPQAVRELAGWCPDSVVEVMLAEHRNEAARSVGEAARAAGVPVTEVSDRALGGLTETENPQGILAVSRYLPELDLGGLEPVAGTGIVVVLHDVRDPGNAGTILRTADAVAAQGVVFAGHSVDPYNGKVIRSSAGSLFHVPFTRAPQTPSALEALDASGFRVLGTRLDAPLVLGEHDCGLDAPTAWVFGSEAHGLPDGLPLRESVRLPIYGAAESLNLAAAAAVCLYASATAQRGISD